MSSKLLEKTEDTKAPPAAVLLFYLKLRLIAVLFLNHKNYLWLIPCVFFFNFIYLFLAVLGLLLHGLFSSCGQRGPHSSFGVWTSLGCGARALEHSGFSICSKWLSSCGAWAWLPHSVWGLSSLTGD